MWVAVVPDFDLFRLYWHEWTKKAMHLISGTFRGMQEIWVSSQPIYKKLTKMDQAMRWQLCGIVKELLS